jgi:hypothetical protein
MTARSASPIAFKSRQKATRLILRPIEGAFGGDVDYAQLVKIYSASPESAKGRYSPAECTGARKERIEGNPDKKFDSTSFAEWQNLTMRMSIRRFTLSTNAVSKKIEKHALSVRCITCTTISRAYRRFASAPRWRPV